MILFTEGLAAGYETEMLARMFFWQLELSKDRDFASLDAGEDYIMASALPDGEALALSVELRREGAVFSQRDQLPRCDDKRVYTRALARLICRCAVESGCRMPRWGTLTGVRPIKLFHTLAEKGFSEREAAEYISREYLVSDEMISLAQQIRRAEHEINLKSDPMGFSLYVSIPFCPQRCSYCSFVSQSVERQRHLMEPYVEALCNELAGLGEIARRLGLKLHTVYFGGGTPTTLSALQLSRLFSQVERSFDLSGLLEYTVEAGRPDTIDLPRLSAIKAAGVSRLSVNPQTMDDNVLRAIGRGHSAAEVISAFELARKTGFDCINMDLIAGLPDDTPEGFCKSLEAVLSLRPENITVHTLTLKRSSTLNEQGAAAESHRRRDETEFMVDYARKSVAARGYFPYYLYRQKNTIGGLDNTGYALPGSEGLYNVFIMDETHTILAAGAGAVTKLKAPGGGKIERIYNHKYPAEYLSGYDNLLKRKERVESFYDAEKQL